MVAGRLDDPEKVVRLTSLAALERMGLEVSAYAADVAARLYDPEHEARGAATP